MGRWSQATTEHELVYLDGVILASDDALVRVFPVGVDA